MLAPKHPSNEPNDEINWEMITSKLEASDQSTTQTINPLNRVAMLHDKQATQQFTFSCRIKLL